MSAPGHNPELEYRLISACMVGGPSDVLAASAASLEPESFADPQCRQAWQALVASVAEGSGTGFGRVLRHFAGLHGGDQAEAVRWLGAVQSLEATSAHRSRLVDDVLGLAKWRKFATYAAQLRAEAQEGKYPSFAALWEAAEPHLRAMQEVAAGTRARTISDQAASAKRQLLEPDPRDSVETGFPGWDREATPPRAGQLIVIAARPGAGKSALAGQIAYHVAQTRPVAFFSLEMSAEEILLRLARMRAGRQGIFYADRIAAELDGLGKLDSLRIYEVESARTVGQIEATCRLLAASPRGLGAVVIDYLQLVTPPAGAKRENREQQVAAMSRAFKLLARTVKAPVFLLAQLNREVERDEGRPPRLSDLRESGSIEQDADGVWFLYRPSDTGEVPDASVGTVALLQAKRRNGPAGKAMRLQFDRIIPAFKQ